MALTVLKIIDFCRMSFNLCLFATSVGLDPVHVFQTRMSQTVFLSLYSFCPVTGEVTFAHVKHSQVFQTPLVLSRTQA